MKKSESKATDLRSRFNSVRERAQTEFLSLWVLVRGQAVDGYETLRKNPNKDGAVLALRRAPLAVLGVAVLILLLLLATCGRQEPATIAAEPPQKRNVGDTVTVTSDQLHQLEIAEIKQYQFRVQKQAIGQIAFNEDASTVVLTPFSGRVTRVLASIGNNVKRGDPLFEVDSPEVVQAQADLIAALNALDKTRAQLNLTKQAFDRQTSLLSDRATSQRELDQARNDFAAAQSDFKTAEGALNAARNRLRVIGRGNAEIERLERERQIDPLITINAPIDGTVVARKIGTGQYVRADAGETLFFISDLSVMWLKASVPEADIPLMRVGHELEVRVSAVPDRVFKAKIIAIGAASDSSTHRVTVRSQIENPDGVLKSEMFASFKIWIGEATSTLGVPLDAAIWEGETVYVWVETAAMTLTRRKVKPGIEQDRVLQVLDGLQPGDKIVVRGAIFIDNQWKQ